MKALLDDTRKTPENDLNPFRSISGVSRGDVAIKKIEKSYKVMPLPCLLRIVKCDILTTWQWADN